MKLSLKEKTKLIRLSERASDLLVKMIDEELPKLKIPTEGDNEFKRILSQIYEICPLLSDSYKEMYNYAQKQKYMEEKGKKEDVYYKQLRRNSSLDDII